jgi:hypothetical protein
MRSHLCSLERGEKVAGDFIRQTPADEKGQKDREIKRLKQKIGELVMDVRRVKRALPVASTRAICRVPGVARPALYRHQSDAPDQPRATTDADGVARIKETM